MTQLPAPLSRRDRQRQTREALIFASRKVFAEDGYHAASLDRIAREAGFSKGAVYSNFDGKSALFLAVMDKNLELAEADFGDPFERPVGPTATDSSATDSAVTDPSATDSSTTSPGTTERGQRPLRATQGFALATLEFIASAARDETIAPQLHQRLTALLDHYATIARKARPADETLSVSDVGTLLAALDQGAGLILLAGDVVPDPEVFTTGMRRLVDPARTVRESEPDANAARGNP